MGKKKKEPSDTNMNIEEKRKKLLRLISELDLPMTKEEAFADAEKLNDEDLDLLIKNYEAVKNYRKEIHKAALALDREKVKEIDENYRKKAEKIQDEYDNKMEVIKGEEDVKVQLMEEEAESEMERIVSEAEKEAEEVEKAADDIESKVNSFVPQN